MIPIFNPLIVNIMDIPRSLTGEYPNTFTFQGAVQFDRILIVSNGIRELRYY